MPKIIAYTVGIAQPMAGQLAEITGTSYSDTTAEAGVTYYYTVRAFDGSTYGNYIPDETILRLTVPEFTITNDTNGVTMIGKKWPERNIPGIPPDQRDRKLDTTDRSK